MGESFTENTLEIYKEIFLRNFQVYNPLEKCLNLKLPLNSSPALSLPIFESDLPHYVQKRIRKILNLLRFTYDELFILRQNFYYCLKLEMVQVLFSTTSCRK